MKITPAHDPNDFATGKRHGLEFINVLDDNGNINGNGTGPFAGQPRFKVGARMPRAAWVCILLALGRVGGPGARLSDPLHAPPASLTPRVAPRHPTCRRVSRWWIT